MYLQHDEHLPKKIKVLINLRAERDLTLFCTTAIP